MFSVIMGVLFLSLAIAIDGSKLLSTKSKLQAISDSAALSGAIVAHTNPKDRANYVMESIRQHEATIKDMDLAASAIVTFDDSTEEVTVNVSSPQSLLFGGIVGSSTVNVGTSSVVSYKLDELDP